jgi:hypothetical protein
LASPLERWWPRHHVREALVAGRPVIGLRGLCEVPWSYAHGFRNLLWWGVCGPDEWVKAHYAPHAGAYLSARRNPETVV